jgi:hypothetical protein
MTPVYSRKTDKRWSTEQSAFPVFAAVQKNMFCTKNFLDRNEGAQIPNTVLIKLRKYSLVYCIPVLKYFSTDLLRNKNSRFLFYSIFLEFFRIYAIIHGVDLFYS